jgi:hypothetical protein
MDQTETHHEIGGAAASSQLPDIAWESRGGRMGQNLSSSLASLALAPVPPIWCHAGEPDEASEREERGLESSCAPHSAMSLFGPTRAAFMGTARCHRETVQSGAFRRNSGQ